MCIMSYQQSLQALQVVLNVDIAGGEYRLSILAPIRPTTPTKIVVLLSRKVSIPTFAIVLTSS